MTSIREWVDEAGGLVHKRELIARGARDRDLTRAVRDGEVRRPRQGWYTSFDPRDPRFGAARVGGRLSGLAALALWGAWAWRRPTTITVSVPANAARLRRMRSAVVVYDPPRVQGRGSASVVDPRDALVRAVAELGDDFESAVALWDWATTCGLFSPDDLAEAEALLPVDRQGLVPWSDHRSQSVLESVARVRLQRDGLRVECQRAAPGSSPFDLLVEGVVALELDGREHHESRFEHDRLKDLAITRAGWQVLRASYSMVRSSWERIVQAVHTALDHHARPRGVPIAPSDETDVVRELPPVRILRRRGRRRRWVCSPVSRGSRSTRTRSTR